MTSKNLQTITSARLRYQLMTADDAELLFQLNQDPEVMRYISGGKPSTREEIEEYFIPRIENFTNPDAGWGLWKASLASTGEFIGWILIRPVDFYTDNPDLENLEVGWRFMRSSWGNGYATEAAQTIKKYLVSEKGIGKFFAIAHPDNSASINIMQKIGMKYINNAVHEDPIVGKTEVVCYQLNCEERD